MSTHFFARPLRSALEETTMLKFMFVMFVLIDSVLLCEWVCIDRNNNIKKRYFNQSNIEVKIPKKAINVRHFFSKNGLKLSRDAIPGKR